MTHIVTIRDKVDIATEQARTDWAEVTGKRQSLKHNIYIDQRTGWRYCGIVGAVAYQYDDPGCYIIAGVQSEPHQRIVIMDYAEHTDLYQMITEMAEHQEAYGCRGDINVLNSWIGDPDRYLSIIARVSQVMEKKYSGSGGGFYVREPADWQESNKRFAMWTRHLRQAMAEKRVVISQSCSGASEISNRLQAFPHGAVDTGKIEQYPGVGALAALVYTVGIERMWERDIYNDTAINNDNDW